MHYHYAYKSFDGVHHADLIEASSRDEVFALLRERGIRPSKVVAVDGAKANGEVRGIRRRVVVASVVVAFVAGVVCTAILAPAVKALVAPPDSPAIIALRARAAEIATTGKAAVESARNAQDKIVLLEWDCHRISEAFRNVLDDLPRESERLEAKRLYADLMIPAERALFAAKPPRRRAGYYSRPISAPPPTP